MRQGRNARIPQGKSREGLRTLRTVPTLVPRKGFNSKKEDGVRRAHQRSKQIGLMRGLWAIGRKLILWTLVFGVLGAGGWAGYQAYERNGFLVLRQVDIVGNQLVPKSEILERAGLELGVKLTSVPVGKVESSLQRLPGIAEVKVSRIFPSRIEIQIKEKAPVAMGFSKEWYGLASDGTRISGLDWGSSDLPIVDGFAGLDSLKRASLGNFLQVAKQSYPELYAKFSQLSIPRRSEDAVEIILRDGRLKVLLALDGGSLKSSLPKNGKKSESNKSLNSLEFLQALMVQQSGSFESGNTIDLRVEGLAYVH